MAVSKAQQASVNKYVKANYDRINVTIPKGEKEIIQERATAHGESVNGFIVRSIHERMERDGPQGAAGTPSGAGAVSLPYDVLKAAQAAAEEAGEALEDFLARAVSEAAERDRLSRNS